MNISDDIYYKCLFYCILFIFLIIILLLVLKNKKEKFVCDTTASSIQLTPSANLIQIDPLNGDLSELNTNDILDAVNCIIKKFTDNKTFNDATLSGTTLSGITNLTGTLTGDITTTGNLNASNISTTGTLSCGNLNTTGGIQLNTRNIGLGIVNNLTNSDHVVIVSIAGTLNLPNQPINGQQILIMPLVDQITLTGNGTHQIVYNGGWINQLLLSMNQPYNLIFVLEYHSDTSIGHWWNF